MAQQIGVDIGGTNLRVGVVEDMCVIYEKRTHADFATLCNTHSPELAWQSIIQITANALQEAIIAHPQVGSVGIGFPGFIDPLTSRISQSPNLPGLCDVDLATDVSRIIGRSVVVENDALAAAYGEYCLNGVAQDSLIYIGLGTGVGGGLIHAGKPFPGQHGVAMEIGHMIVEHNGRQCGCGNRGCMEKYASATGLSLSYKASTGHDLDTGKIAELARSGDKDAIAAYNLAGSSLAQALAHILKVVDVGQVVVGGGMSQAWSLMRDAFNQRLQEDLIPVLRDKIDIKISSSGDQAGIIGAALLSSGTRSGI